MGDNWRLDQSGVPETNLTRFFFQQGGYVFSPWLLVAFNDTLHPAPWTAKETFFRSVGLDILVDSDARPTNDKLMVYPIKGGKQNIANGYRSFQKASGYTRVTPFPQKTAVTPKEKISVGATKISGGGIIRTGIFRPLDNATTVCMISFEHTDSTGAKKYLGVKRLTFSPTFFRVTDLESGTTLSMGGDSTAAILDTGQLTFSVSGDGKKLLMEYPGTRFLLTIDFAGSPQVMVAATTTASIAAIWVNIPVGTQITFVLIGTVFDATITSSRSGSVSGILSAGINAAGVLRSITYTGTDTMASTQDNTQTFVLTTPINTTRTIAQSITASGSLTITMPSGATKTFATHSLSATQNFSLTVDGGNNISAQSNLTGFTCMSASLDFAHADPSNEFLLVRRTIVTIVATVNMTNNGVATHRVVSWTASTHIELWVLYGSSEELLSSTDLADVTFSSDTPAWPSAIPMPGPGVIVIDSGMIGVSAGGVPDASPTPTQHRKLYTDEAVVKSSGEWVVHTGILDTATDADRFYTKGMTEEQGGESIAGAAFRTNLINYFIQALTENNNTAAKAQALVNLNAGNLTPYTIYLSAPDTSWQDRMYESSHSVF